MRRSPEEHAAAPSDTQGSARHSAGARKLGRSDEPGARYKVWSPLHPTPRRVSCKGVAQEFARRYLAALRDAHIVTSLTWTVNCRHGIHRRALRHAVRGCTYSTGGGTGRVAPEPTWRVKQMSVNLSADVVGREPITVERSSTRKHLQMRWPPRPARPPRPCRPASTRAACFCASDVSARSDLKFTLPLAPGGAFTLSVYGARAHRLVDR